MRHVGGHQHRLADPGRDRLPADDEFGLAVKDGYEGVKGGGVLGERRPASKANRVTVPPLRWASVRLTTEPS